MSNCEPWLLWIVIANAVSIAPSRVGVNSSSSPPRSKAALTMLGGLDDDAGVAVVEAQLVVVLGDEQRTADVGGAVGVEAGDRGGEPALDAGVQAATPWGPRRCAQSTRNAPSAAMASWAAPACAALMTARPAATASSRTAASAASASGSAASTGIQVTSSGWVSRTRHHLVGIAVGGSLRRGGRCRRRSGGRGRGRRCRRRCRDAGWRFGCLAGRRARRLAPGHRGGCGTDDVAEHGTGLDRRELAGVADEDEAGVGADGLDEARHQRQRDHRGLVDDHDVVRQAVCAVVAEAAVASGSPAEQAVQRGGVEVEELGARGVVDVERRRPRRGRLPRGGRRPCRSARRAR